MFTRGLTLIVLGPGLLLAGIAVIAAPGVVFVGVAFGVLVGAFSLMWVRDASSADAATTTRAARRAGLLVGAANLSTQQLCLAWQRTYFALLDLPAGAPRSEIVALRGRLLDEIERRDRHGFSRWLDTGARASSNPGRYLTGDR